MDKRAKELIEIGNSERQARMPLVSLWQELADNFYPFRADFTRKRSLGDDFVSGLSDSYPVLARQELGNALSTMLRNRNVEWYSASTGDDDRDSDPEVARRLEYLARVHRRAMYDPLAKFTRATKEGDQDYSTFGQCVISIEEAPNKEHLLYRNWHLRDCVWSDDECGTTNRMDREFTISARNYIRLYPKNIPEQVKRCAEKEPNKQIKMRHIVMPRDEYDINMSASERRSLVAKPFASIYIDVENEVMKKEGTLPRFNYVVPRWQTVSDSQYAYSPAAIIALPDARMIQAMSRTIQEAAEYAVDPAWKASEDAVRSDVNVFPGGIVWIDSAYDEKTGKAFEAIGRGGDVRLGVEEKQDAREMIAQAFLLNKLQLPAAEGSMTATEVMRRVEEYVRAALPLFEPIETEYNNPICDITYEMLLERNAFDLDQLRGDREEEFKFKFQSPLQEAEVRKRVTQFQETIGLITGIAQLDPQKAAKSAERIDLDKALVEAIRGTGAPADWFVASEDADQGIKEVEGQAAEQQAMAQVQQIAGAAPSIVDATTKLAAEGLIPT